MKRFAFMLIIALAFGFSSCASSDKVKDVVRYEKVIEFSGKSQKSLYSYVDSSFSRVFNYPEVQKESSDANTCQLTGKYMYDFTKKMVNYRIPLFVSISTKDGKVRVLMESTIFYMDKSKKGAFWGGWAGALMNKNAETHYTASYEIVQKELESHFENICSSIKTNIASDSSW